MKTKSMALLSVLALGTITVMPIHAATSDITIGVAETKPKVVSVNVPAVIPMAVVADKASGTTAPTLMVGSSTTASGGAGGVTPHEGTSAADLTFDNVGDTEVDVTKATVDNVFGSSWTLTPTAPATADVNKLNMAFGTLNTLANEVRPGSTNDITGTGINLPAKTKVNVPMTATVGGTNADYKKTADAVAFHVTWEVTPK